MSNDTTRTNGSVGVRNPTGTSFSLDAQDSLSPSRIYSPLSPRDAQNNIIGHKNEKHPHAHVLDASVDSDDNHTLADNDAANIIVSAGRLPEEVYTTTLSWWRAAVRRRLVGIVEWESGVLAQLQVRRFLCSSEFLRFFFFTSFGKRSGA